ncbi:methylated-DNA--[protein]-cysteine S-methyltransferase [Clostridium massiliodielmoense]|uniref:methylated-DNA--[protein]-cysteine S-methyltransferase n=1 Tax=Clostridium massiliodielmoense TaxID=1776385 RepID=UPI0001664860|nr:methylated-DNA--[protein]-cysteine S-methyltransferase [Clostridium massiliodielmoense]EDS77032.1 methylated-dna--protein-cysteine methyltransferase [Clostridium botulinum C str. Eklund]KEH94046.1 cysteine methyltransferase [Clostridium botulinum C/D str. BKT12695]NEZ49954.1 methylated-DNA--[protein]-cysteine S-methyltransferase [Clostridium botulinum]
MTNLYELYYSSPIGILRIKSTKYEILSLEFVDEKILNRENTSILKEASKQLDEYFNGIRKEFDLNIRLEGTEFQKKVWNELLKIPYGEVITYKDIAIRIGNEKAVRAVGNANNKNKIPIIIPCHRVIGSNRKLVGYLGGLDKKLWLLNHEK